MNDQTKQEETAEIAPAPENVTQISKAKKPSKIDIKRAQQFEERILRTMNKHSVSREEALRRIAKEDYDKLPVDVKLARLEAMVVGGFQQLSQDMTALHHNDRTISRAFEVNYRVLAKLFVKLGISDEEQKKIVQETEQEILKEQAEAQKAAEKAEAERQQKAAEEQEKARIEAGAGAEGEEPQAQHYVAEGATEFGG